MAASAATPVISSFFIVSSFSWCLAGDASVAVFVRVAVAATGAVVVGTLLLLIWRATYRLATPIGTGLVHRAKAVDRLAIRARPLVDPGVDRRLGLADFVCVEVVAFWTGRILPRRCWRCLYRRRWCVVVRVRVVESRPLILSGVSPFPHSLSTLCLTNSHWQYQKYVIVAGRLLARMRSGRFQTMKITTGGSRDRHRGQPACQWVNNSIRSTSAARRSGCRGPGWVGRSHAATKTKFLRSLSEPRRFHP
jgi:hypothetical protein